MISRILNHPLLKSSLIYTISDGINKSIPFFILPILSHFLLPADYGIVANFGVLTGIISLLITCSIDGAIAVNYYQMEQSKIRVFIFNAFLVSFFLFLIVLIAVLLFHEYIYQYLSIPFDYQILCVVLGFFSLFTSINLVLWRLENKPLAFGAYDISHTMLNVGLSLVFIVILHQTWQGRVNGIIISAIIYGLFSFFFLLKRGFLTFEFNREFFKAIFVFGIPLIPHSLSFWLRSGVDRMIITNFWGAEAVGLYATGFQFGTLVAFLVGAFNNAFSPYLYKSLSNPDEVELKKTKLKMVKMTFGIMLGLLFFGLIFIALSKFIIITAFSDSYVDAVIYINWAILGQIFQGFYILFVNYIFFAQKTKMLALFTFSCAVFQVIMSYFLVKYMGPIGAAYSSVFTSFLTFLIIMFYSKRVYSMPWLFLLKNNKTV